MKNRKELAHDWTDTCTTRACQPRLGRHKDPHFQRSQLCFRWFQILAFNELDHKLVKKAALSLFFIALLLTVPVTFPHLGVPLKQVLPSIRALELSTICQISCFQHSHRHPMICALQGKHHSAAITALNPAAQSYLPDNTMQSTQTLPLFQFCRLCEEEKVYEKQQNRRDLTHIVQRC